jgi:chorismate mutase
MSSLAYNELEKTLDDMVQTISSLEVQVIQLTSEKSALVKAASSSKLDEQKLAATLDDLERLAFINSSGREELKSYLQEDANNVLGVISKIASLALEAPSIGGGVKRISTTCDIDERDPYGWGDFLSTKIN